MAKTLLDVIQFETYVTAVAGRAGVSVQWDDADATPRTDGKVIWIPRINSLTPDATLVQLRYFIKHEVSHIVHTNFRYFARAKVKGLLQFICNLLEDNRIDYLNDKEWGGDVRLSNAFAETYAARIAAMEGEVSEDMKKVAPLFAWEAKAREWIGTWHLIAEAVKEKGLSPSFAPTLDKLMPYLPRLISLRTSAKGGTRDLLELARDILQEVYGEDADKYMEGFPDDAAAGQEDGEDSGESDGGKASKAGESEGTSEEMGGDAIITVDKLSEMMGEHLVSRTGTHLEHSVKKGKGWVVPAPADYIINRKFSGVNYLNMLVVKRELENNVRPLAGKLRTKLQVRSKGHYEYGTKSGKLHTGSLHRLVSGRGTEAESRVFRRHVTSDTLDTAVSLLVDCSSSMSGIKFYTATAAAASVAMALKPLHLPFNVLGFSTEYTGECRPIINVFNDWGENVTQEELLHRFGVAAGKLEDNSDGDCIAWAANYLQHRKEKRKILIVLSDGAPAGRYWAGSVSAYTKEVISTLERQRLVEVYGIGILDHNVTMYYTKNMVINKVSELPSVLLSTLDKAL